MEILGGLAIFGTIINSLPNSKNNNILDKKINKIKTINKNNINVYNSDNINKSDKYIQKMAKQKYDELNDPETKIISRNIRNKKKNI